MQVGLSELSSPLNTLWPRFKDVNECFTLHNLHSQTKVDEFCKKDEVRGRYLIVTTTNIRLELCEVIALESEETLEIMGKVNHRKNILPKRKVINLDEMRLMTYFTDQDYNTCVLTNSRRYLINLNNDLPLGSIILVTKTYLPSNVSIFCDCLYILLLR